ncbi:mck1 dosage suppressor [Yamadazyma tenuis]|nr:mck1 dosage suppressor [Yamadazyma tenuis]
MEGDDRLNLNVRTGSASTLYNSLVFTFGGLTIGLDIPSLSVPEILTIFNARLINQKSKNLLKYISGELFYLSLIDRCWSRVVLADGCPRPNPRLFHEILAYNNHLYLFGGLVINPKYNLQESAQVDSIPHDLLVPSNDLWEFNLELNTWKLLYSPETCNHPFVPTPRFCHKMTTLTSLSFMGKPDHFGVFIAGGKDINSNLLYDNVVFDLVDGKFFDHEIELHFSNTHGDFSGVRESGALNVDYYNSIIVNINNQFNHYYNENADHLHPPKKSNPSDTNSHHDNPDEGELKDKPTTISELRKKSGESIVVYSPVNDSTKSKNPLLSFKVGKTIKDGKVLPVHRKVQQQEEPSTKVVPHNLRYPTGGLFGQNLIITGFLPNDYDISIFIFNKPTGKWSRLNIFCNHDYGSHRFWGGYAWQSHHKVVLIGNYVTSRTTSSVRYFSCMITVSLPITNILASSELAGGGHYHDAQGNRVFFDDINKSTTDDTDSSNNPSSSDTENERDEGRDSLLKSIDRPLTPPTDSRRPSYASRGSRGSVSTTKSPRAISFSEYVHYAAPTTNFTTIRSVFPPAAITLGRNFLDRYGDLVADFELISVSGDRIPVSLMVLIQRWGNYFIDLLAKGYVSAVEKFDQSQKLTSVDSRLLTKGSSGVGNSLKSDPGFKSSFVSNASSFSSENNHSIASTPLLSQSNLTAAYNDSEDPKSEKYHLSMPLNSKKSQKDAPLFRLPFQDSASTSSLDRSSEQSLRLPQEKIIDPLISPPGSTPMQTGASGGNRKDSVSSFSSGGSLMNSHLQDIPPQLPLPTEPIPSVPSNPSSFKSSSRKNSTDLASPRGSLIHTLTALRSIPISKSPRGSPFNSPRASVSQQGHGNFVGMGIIDADLNSSPIPGLKLTTMSASASGSSRSSGSPTPDEPKSRQLPGTETVSSEGDADTSNKRKSNCTDDNSVDPSLNEQNDNDKGFDPFDNVLLNFENLENGTFQMESSLIPRKLYIPFATASVKAFCEYLYTGQIGNKWLLTPTTLDNLALTKHYKVNLLYDLICEVLYGIIGRRESWIVKQSRSLKEKYFKLLQETGTSHDPDFEFPLDEYEGFMDTVDDGYLDMVLLKKTLKIHSTSIYSKRDSTSRKSSKSSRRSSKLSSTFDFNEVNDKEMEAEPDTAPYPEQEGVEAKDKEKETDSSVDLSSTSDASDTDFGTGFLDIQHDLPNIGPRSKSVFDRGDIDTKKKPETATTKEVEIDEQMQKEIDLTLTLEQLVSPVSPVPSPYIIDLIFETVTFVADLKLMLRVNNVKQMGKLLTTFEKDVEEQMARIQDRYEERQEAFRTRDRRSGSVAMIQRLPLPRTSSYDSEQVRLHPVGSASSLNTMGSRATSVSLSRVPTVNDNESAIASGPVSEGGGGSGLTSGLHTPTGSTSNLASLPLERARTSTSLRPGAFGGLTPFKPIKTDPKLNRAETNRQLDKRITKLIKKDEKLKHRAEKEEKTRHSQMLRAEKKADKDTDRRKTVSRAPSKTFDEGVSDFDSASVVSSSSKKHRHGILHHLGDRIKSRTNEESAEFKRVVSSDVNSIHSVGSDKKKHSLFGLKK